MAQHSRTTMVITGWLFAATMMIVVGAFQIIGGITGIVHNNFYLNVHNYTFDLDTTAWGWIHLALGALVLITGIALLSGRMWAAVTGIVLAGLSAINNFFFLPYYPLWSILVIATAVFVIWALARMIDIASGSEPERWSTPEPAAEQQWPQATGTGSGSATTDVKPPPQAGQPSRTTPTTGSQPTGPQG